MEKRLNKVPYKMRLLLSYITVLLLPVIFLFSLYYYNSMEQLRKQVETGEINIAQTYCALLDAQFKNLESITQNLCYYQNIRPFCLKDDVIKAQEVIQTLNRYEIGHHFFSNIYIHFYCDEYFYSSSSSITNINFIDSFIFQEKTVDLYSSIANLSNPLLLPGVSHKGQNGLLVIHPFQWHSSSKGVICYFIQEKSIYNILSSGIQPDRRSLSVITSTENTVWNQLLQNSTLANSSAIICERKQQHLLYGQPIADTCLYLVSVSIPMKTDILYKHAIILIVRLAVVMSLGMILCRYLTRKYYSPIHNLQQVVSKNNHNNNRSEDVFQCIQDAYLKLEEQNQEMSKKIDQQLLVQQRLLIASAMIGDLPDEVTFQQQCEDVGLNLKGPLYYILLSLSSNNTTVNWKDVFPESVYEIYNVSHDELFLISTAKEITQIQKAGEYYLSAPCYSISELPWAYASVKSSYDIRKQLNTQENSFNYFAQYQQILLKFEAQLAVGNIKQATTYINQLIPQLELLSMQKCRQLYSHIFRLIEIASEGNTKATLPGYNDLISYVNQKELSDVLHNCLDELSKEKNIANVDNSSTLNIQSILSYVHTHYSNVQFSLHALAQEYNVSVSYISQFFKENKGIGLLDYYTQLRMAKAKELLSTTDMNINAIAVSVGYFRPSSFSRRFKQLQGISPAEYHKIHKTDIAVTAQ